MSTWLTLLILLVILDLVNQVDKMKNRSMIIFTIGDLVIYSGHGICRIDDICDQTYSGIERTYIFKELAYSLNTSSELMEQKIYEIIGKN